MKTTVTARHCEIADALRRRAETVTERLAHLSPHVLECNVVFDGAGDRFGVEVRVHVRRGQWLIGTGDADDHRTALDRAEEKLRKQLERATTQARRGRRGLGEPT